MAWKRNQQVIIKYIYEHQNSPKETWYVIKVLQEDNKTAVSSPIFINHLNVNHI